MTIEVDAVYGPSVSSMGWVPAPSYILRRDRLMRLLPRLPTGRLVEIGCGAGALLYELNQLGFCCEAYETSSAALRIAKKINRNQVIFHESLDSIPIRAFNCVMALEVLEHIENDKEALSLWASWLRPGGSLILSVPSKMSNWTASDVWAGHFRRYERQNIIALIQQAGFKIDVFESYGFPLANLIAPVRAYAHARQLTKSSHAGEARDANNAQSGVRRDLESKTYPLLRSWVGKGLMACAVELQNRTTRFDVGTGYFVLCSLR